MTIDEEQERKILEISRLNANYAQQSLIEQVKVNEHLYTVKVIYNPTCAIWFKKDFMAESPWKAIELCYNEIKGNKELFSWLDSIINSPDFTISATTK